MNPILKTRIQRKLNLALSKAVVGDENGQIYSDPVNRKGYIKARRRSATGLSKAFDVRLGRNFQMALTPGAAIVLGWEDGEEVALGPDVVGLIAAGGDPNQNNAANRPTQRWVKFEDLLPFSTAPTSPESLYISVSSLFWIWGKTVNHFYGSEDSGGTAKGKVNLTSYIPAAGSHCLVGIFLKNDNTIEVSASTTQTMDIPIDASDVQECLTGTSAFTIAGDIWYLHNNQSAVTQSDFLMPLRQVYNVPDANYAPVRVVTAAGAVTVTIADYVVIVNKSSGAATTVNLPSSPATGLTFIIKDGKGDAATNNITITPAAGNIDGAATKVISTAYGSAAITYNGTEWSTSAAGGGVGAVTSVALTATPTGIFDVSGSPVTGAGTLALSMDNQNANIVLAGPASGAAATPAFRALALADLPQLQHICQGRLTLTSGTPVTTSDVTAATTLYFAPYKGGLIGLYSGSAWVLRAFTELSVAVPSTTNTLYDVFVYDNSGTPTLETLAWNSPTNGTITGATNATPIVVTYTGTDPANDELVTIAGVGGNTAANGTWRIANINTGAKTFELKTLANANSSGSGAFTTNGTWQRADENQSRATALTTQDGVLVKSGATTRRYVGTIRTTTTSGQTEDSQARRFVWNYYNRADRYIYVNDSTGSWSYATSAWRTMRNDLTNRTQVVVGYAEDILIAKQQILLQVSDTANAPHIAIGMDSFTSPTSSDASLSGMATSTAFTPFVILFGRPGVGYHYLTPIEYSNATVTFYGGGNQSMEGTLKG